MAPNQKQITVSDLIKMQASFWASTNDINSPTHFCDISETLNSSICDCFSESEKQEIEVKLIELLQLVRSY
jgi:hypothetical protein